MDRTNTDKYMQDIRDFERITEAEEFDIAALIAQGSEDALYKLITANLRLVVRIAYDFEYFTSPLPERISAGNLGLFTAAKRFDPNKGSKFSSYAAWWIKQAIRRYACNIRVIRIPPHSLVIINKIKKAQRKLCDTATDKDIGKEIGESHLTVKYLKNEPQNIRSLDAVFDNGDNGDNNGSLVDLIINNDPLPEEQIINKENLKQLQVCLKQLKDRDRKVIELRFGLNGYRRHTLEETCKIVGRTRERMRQIEVLAIKELKRSLDLMN